jgi:serine acetyltransferase
MFKSYYKFIRILFSPFFYLLQIISNCDIHHKAEIQGGINIHHPSAGIVISGKAKIGEMLTLTGGNIIGVKGGSKGIVIGNNCNIGANACIIGPLQLGNNIKIAAMACVVKSFHDNNLSLIGVPA